MGWGARGGRAARARAPQRLSALSEAPRARAHTCTPSFGDAARHRAPDRAASLRRTQTRASPPPGAPPRPRRATGSAATPWRPPRRARLRREEGARARARVSLPREALAGEEQHTRGPRGEAGRGGAGRGRGVAARRERCARGQKQPSASRDAPRRGATHLRRRTRRGEPCARRLAARGAQRRRGGCGRRRRRLPSRHEV